MVESQKVKIVFKSKLNVLMAKFNNTNYLYPGAWGPGPMAHG